MYNKNLSLSQLRDDFFEGVGELVDFVEGVVEGDTCA